MSNNCYHVEGVNVGREERMRRVQTILGPGFAATQLIQQVGFSYNSSICKLPGLAQIFRTLTFSVPNRFSVAHSLLACLFGMRWQSISCATRPWWTVRYEHHQCTCFRMRVCRTGLHRNHSWPQLRFRTHPTLRIVDCIAQVMPLRHLRIRAASPKFSAKQRHACLYA